MSSDGSEDPALFPRHGLLFPRLSQESFAGSNDTSPNAPHSNLDTALLPSHDRVSQSVSDQESSDFKAGASPAAEASRFTSDTRSLDSSVLDTLWHSPPVGAGGPHAKYKFAKAYEEAYRSRHPELADTESVFGVSGLSEYQRFLELSQLDRCIDERVQERSAQARAPVLTVVEPEHMDQYFTEGLAELAESRVPKPARAKVASFFRRLHAKSEPPKGAQDLQQQSPLWRPFSRASAKQGVYLHRSLEVRHLQMISFGGTLGVGLYLNSGKAFSIAGGLGLLLAFMIVGLVVLATVVSFCEMVTFVSVVDGVSGLSSRFVDESFGFATGWLYFLSFSFGLAGEIVASVIILSYFPDTKILQSGGATAGFATLFLLVCVISNMINVRVFGEIEYVCSFMKIIVTLIAVIVMIVINRGGMGTQGVVGFKYWDKLQSIFDHNMIFGPFRPTFDLLSNGLDSQESGIGGNLGRFLSLLTAIVVASYAYSGTEIVCVAACEAKDPRKALPSATKRVFWRILLFYCLSSFVVSLNIYAGDPRLLRFYSGMTGVAPDAFDGNYAVNYVGGNHCHLSAVYTMGTGSQSPWIVAFQSVGLCLWSSLANIFLFLFALSCGNSHLYVSSRTIYSLALQHKAPAFLRKCNRNGIPYYAVMVSLIPALCSYTCVNQLATVVFQNLTSLISSSGVFVWFAMCLSYTRFYFGLKQRPDIIGRDDKAYPYRSPFQPYSAIFGMVGTAIILLAMGFVVFLKGMWDTMFFFASYGTFIIFAVLYLGHRLLKGTTMSNLEALDFESGRREKDIYIWDGGKEYNIRKLKDVVHKVARFMA